MVEELESYHILKERIYKEFVKDSMLPLLGISKQKIEKIFENLTTIEDTQKFCTKMGITFDCIQSLRQSNNEYIICFGDIFDNKFYFYLNLEINADDIALIKATFLALNYIINANSFFFKNSKEKRSIKEYLNPKNSNNYLSNLFNYAIEKGILSWLIGFDNSLSNIEKLLSILKDWSIKTYEGHKVCFGFLITDSKANQNDHSNFVDKFLTYLSDEYSATLSDGISSIVEIDKDCNFVKYHSIYENNEIEECNLENLKLPYRFAQIISRFINNKTKKGIFLLQNGDIIISKNKEIYFIYRNLKWLDFRYGSFRNVISNSLGIDFKKNKVKDKLLKRIYCSILDVSFSHVGGIISIVNSKEFKNKPSILSDIDDLSNELSSEDIYKKNLLKEINISNIDNKECILQYIKNCKNTLNNNEINKLIESNYELKCKNEDLRKRILKREVILSLISNNSKLHGFMNIDRKLTCELIGLDGACILDLSGNVISFGAIIQNDKGSSGGGRGAAAKKLSTYGGFAIKISTDGYIEVFKDRRLIYSIK